jgi:hypothetical protein
VSSGRWPTAIYEAQPGIDQHPDCKRLSDRVSVGLKKFAAARANFSLSSHRDFESLAGRVFRDAPMQFRLMRGARFIEANSLTTDFSPRRKQGGRRLCTLGNIPSIFRKTVLIRCVLCIGYFYELLFFDARDIELISSRRET